MKYFFMASIIVLLLIACATPNEPKVNESFPYEQFIASQGYIRDFCMTENYLFIAEDEAGCSVYNFDGEIIDHFYNDNMSVRAIHVSEQDSLIFVYDRYASPAGITLFHLPTLFNSVLFNVAGATSDVDQIFTDDSGELRFYWIGSNGIYSSFYNESIEFWEPGENIDFPNSVSRLDKHDDTLYVSGSQMGVFITSLSTGDISATIDTPGEAVDVKYVDNTLFVACQEAGIAIIDITNTENPITLFHEDTTGYAQSIAIQDNILVVGSGGGGVYVYDISDLQNVKQIERIDDSLIGYTYKVEIKDNYIYAGTKQGLYKILIQE